MAAKTSKHKNLVRIFSIFLGIYIINLVVPLSTISHTQRMWLWASIIVTGLSLFILVKEGLPEKRNILIALFLAFLAGLISPKSGVVTFFSFISATRVFEISPSEIQVLKRPPAFSIALGVGVGIVLGFVNLFLAANQVPEFQPSFYAFVVSLNPGIHEEVSFRFFLYAFSIYVLGGKVTERREKVWVYVLMVLPHVLLHFPDQFFANGIFVLDLGTLVFGTIILSALFGLPFALLMLKRDLATSMLAHTIVDFIRFTVYGLPF